MEFMGLPKNLSFSLEIEDAKALKLKRFGGDAWSKMRPIQLSLVPENTTFFRYG